MRVRIREGKKHGAFQEYREGDELEITAAELVAFGDKFVVIDDPTDAPSDPSIKDKREFKSRVTFDASTMTVSEVLRFVENGTIAKAIALESERNGRNRKSLIHKLEALD